MKAGRREMTKLKRRKEPTGVRSRGSSMADLQEQLDRRTRELNEALDHQTAASAVLSVIGRSPPVRRIATLNPGRRAGPSERQ
jgi:hypothetical protein